MANIKSQIKRNRQNDKKRLRNRVYRGEARIAVRTARTNIDEGTPESKAALMQAISTLDRAAEQGVIHKNNAARRKSRLVKAFAKMVPAPVEAVPAEGEPVVGEPVKTSSSKGKKTSSRRPAARKLEEPAVVVDESMEESKAAPKPKKAAAASKEKKTEAKKSAAKTTAKKKPAATKES